MRFKTYLRQKDKNSISWFFFNFLKRFHRDDNINIYMHTYIVHNIIRNIF